MVKHLFQSKLKKETMKPRKAHFKKELAYVIQRRNVGRSSRRGNENAPLKWHET